MSLDGVLERLREEGGRPEGLKLAAAEVGRALVQPPREALRAFQVGLARTGAEEKGDWARGYREALLDVLAAFEDQAAHAEAAREVEVRALRGEWRRALPLMRGGPFRPGELQERLGRDKTQVSHLLREMGTPGVALVELLPAREGQDRRARLYQLTLRGEALARLAAQAEQAELTPSRPRAAAASPRRRAVAARRTRRER